MIIKIDKYYKLIKINLIVKKLYRSILLNSSKKFLI
jgi:hypothetical protein